MKDRTLDFKEGLAIIRAYLCTGSRDWLDNNEDDSPDVRIIKWVRSTLSVYLDAYGNDISVRLWFHKVILFFSVTGHCPNRTT